MHGRRGAERTLADAKTSLTGAYPLRFDGNETIVGILVGIEAIGFPLDHAETRNARVEAATMDDVRRVASEL